ncbi:uncharacterized protein MYCFIDRAFT_181299 [Pseudocercospora fijiensis CIRAD86]|uniref:Uncharacterized protein n=1 Tax=Pseudocercospora fijiensis (strain CIRAD86) TaxID=383855 RepID=N1Q7F1_PSEFD|nr:uncharacterized protein MYCFIDRAFT_181299 [Pseudocercospora fijiensis CIRAD86]EME88590.1 hypothetical protein MYCFIDRAFT_181299 [Pseudocercospora fijiensis CIRAD86]
MFLSDTSATKRSPFIVGASRDMIIPDGECSSPCKIEVDLNRSELEQTGTLLDMAVTRHVYKE